MMKKISKVLLKTGFYRKIRKKAAMSALKDLILTSAGITAERVNFYPHEITSPDQEEKFINEYRNMLLELLSELINQEPKHLHPEFLIFAKLLQQNSRQGKYEAANFIQENKKVSF